MTIDVSKMTIHSGSRFDIEERRITLCGFSLNDPRWGKEHGWMVYLGNEYYPVNCPKCLRILDQGIFVSTPLRQLLRRYTVAEVQYKVKKEVLALLSETEHYLSHAV